MRTTTFVLVASLATPLLAPLRAQTLRYDVVPQATLRDSLTDPTGGGLEIRSWTSSLRVPLGRLLSRPRTTVSHEVTLRYFQADYAGWDDVLHGPKPIDRAFTFRWEISLQHRLSPKWLIYLSTAPRSDFRIDGFAAIIRPGVRATYGLGAALSLNFGSSIPIPVVFLNWNNGHDLSIETVLPAFLQFWYRPGGRVDVGFLARLTGNRLNANRERFPDADSPVFVYANPTFGPSLRLHLFPGAFIKFDGGTTIGSRFEFRDRGRTLLDLSPKERAFLRVSAKLGFAQRWWCGGEC